MSTTFSEISTFDVPLDRAATTFDEGATYEAPLDRDSVAFQEVTEYMVYSTIGLSAQTVVNRVWDTVAADFVRWATSEIDRAGASYPGPGTFGVDTSDFVVETIQYARV